MATSIIINGRTVTRPGVYAVVKSGIKTPTLNASYGNVCIIDDGLGAFWGGGAGVNGTLASGIDAVYELTGLQQMRDFVKGGEFWNLAKPLFKPAGNGIPGASRVFIVKAATTTPAQMAYTFDKGSMTIKTRDEGQNANGVLYGGQLSKGYGSKFVASPTNAGKYLLQFFVGTYKGIDPLNNAPYDNVSQANALPSQFMASPECSTVQELIDWCRSSNDFKDSFQLSASSITSNTASAAAFDCTPLAALVGKVINVIIQDPVLGAITIASYTPVLNDTATIVAVALKTAINLYGNGYSATNTTGSLTVTAPASYGATMNTIVLGFYYDGGSASATFSGGTTVASTLIAGDVTSNAGYKLATGGTETYGSADFTAAIEAIKEVDNTFFLATSYGVAGAIGANNTTIFDYLVNSSKYEKFMVVGAGYNKAQFAGSSDSSEAVAKHFDSDKVILVHGGAKSSSKQGFLMRSSLYKAATVLGRLCGLTPQTPITFKSIDIDGEVHPLSDSEKEYALKVGVLTTQFDSELGYYVVQQGITSLQKNDNIVNEDASSFDIAIKRIEASLNKDICVNAKRVFFGKSAAGPNRTTVTEADIKAWLEGFLANKATEGLIVRGGNVSVTITDDTYFVNYEFVPNFPINKMVFTGTLLEK
jgi:hypothetical protein